MLPRLALMKIVAYPVVIPYDDTPIAFTSEAWTELGGDRSGAADRLLDAAERALTRAEAVGGEHPAVSGGSLLEAHGLVKVYKGRRVVNDVSVRLEQGEIVGLLEPHAHVVHHAAALVHLDESVRLEQAAAAHRRVLAAHRLGPGERALGGVEQPIRGARPVAPQLGPRLRGERDRRVVVRDAHRVGDDLHEREPRQHGRAETGAKLLHRQSAEIRQARAAGVGAQLEELLPEGDREVTEGRAAVLVGHAGERRGGERERGVPGGEQVGDHRLGGFFLVVSAGGLGSSCTPLAPPVTNTLSTRSALSRTSIMAPRE